MILELQDERGLLEPLVELKSHMLVSRDPKNLDGRCGFRDEVKHGERLPDHFTAWMSRVTCQECLDFYVSHG